MFPKEDNYRNEKLTRLARNQQCQLLIADSVYHDPETSVWCHSNQSIHGKGGHLKAHDCFGAIGCVHCHAALDAGGSMSRSEKVYRFAEAMVRTRMTLLYESLIVETQGPALEIHRLVHDDQYWLNAWKVGALKVNA